MDPRTFDRLGERLRGELVTPDHPAYGEARKVYNAMHDRRPAAVVRAANVADVIAAVNEAREQGVELAVRGGGHSGPGFGTVDGGLVLDLGRMRGIRVDPEKRTLRAEGGCTWGDFNHAAHAFGLAAPGGIVSTTGIGGLTLGGGIGYLSRAFGLSCDNLVSADIVTADGDFRIVSEERWPGLFWAIRGGGGNFGVVTSFEYRLHRVGEIYGGPTFFPLEADVLRGYRAFLGDVSERLGAVLGITVAPPLPFLPAAWHGKPVAALIACWPGPPEDGARALEPMEQMGEPIGAAVGPMPYPAINTLFDELVPPGLQQYWKGSFVRRLTDPAIEAHVEHGARTPCAESGAFLFPIDGACRRVPHATAFAFRDCAFAAVVAGAWPDPADNEANVAWVRAYHEALRPHSEEGAYVNFLAAEEGDRVKASYGPSYERLVELKTRYDPENLFRRNHNIPPAA